MLSAKLIRSQLQPIWWIYWDYYQLDEADYLMPLNDLFNNPIKHEYVTNLKDHPYPKFLSTQGRELLLKRFREYPEYKSLVLDEDSE